MENIKLETTILSSGIILLLAVGCGFSVANVYYAQPLLDIIGETFNINEAKLGIVVTISQIGYGLGLFLLVPLGDLADSRKLIIYQFILLALFLMVVSLASSFIVLLAGMFLVGTMAVVTQSMVAYAASMSDHQSRGQVVGAVTSGVVVGLLLARTVAGTLTQFTGWRSVYLFSAILSLILGLTFFLVLPPPNRNKRAALSYPKLLLSMFTLFRRHRLLTMRSFVGLFIFAAGQVLWTPMVLPLSQAPFSFSHMTIGLFGLAGVMGVIGASKAGSLADRGYAKWTSLIALILMIISWIFTAFIYQSLLFLIFGIIIFDMGLQAVHVTNQSIILKIDPEASGRITAGYMIFYSIGSAIGSVTSTFVFSKYGWTGVCMLGLVFGLLALISWIKSVKT
ncbi:MFS transporter [Dysgonomonas sp. HDW5A]|uniref:MFS transporter n=1 Tax=Dysgonomonas sp. HDW5A TaxID=2714926 RepID=UPI00140C3FDC|nr:MFS transporter [Dysgonomonas sp. HDW5A]QIK59182.1 MFS transporter [Dysgonomonas sp. HDW5A]